MKKMTWFALVLIAVLVTAGCGGGANNGNTTAGNAAQNGANAEGGSGNTNAGNTGAANAEEGDAEQQYKIAISQIAEHPSLDATKEGFLAALNDAGITEGTNLTVDDNNAQGEQANNLSIAQKLAGSDNDLILAIATPSAQAVAQQVKDTPVLFAAVTDPLAAKIVSDLEKPGANISGASDTNPEAITKLMDFIASNFPDVKSVGLVINEGETNAVVMADQAEEALSKHGIELIRAAVTNTSEVKQAAESLIGRADAFYITLDNTVVSAIDTLLELAKSEQIPLFSSDRDTVEKGAFATVGFKYYDHGYQVGEMAVEILKNGQNPGDMTVTLPDKLDFILNTKAAGEMGIEVTDAMKSTVADPEQNLIE